MEGAVRRRGPGAFQLTARPAAGSLSQPPRGRDPHARPGPAVAARRPPFPSPRIVALDTMKGSGGGLGAS